MDLAGRVIVVTGAGGGIGAALCHRFAEEHPAAVVAADIDGSGATRTAQRLAEMGVPALGVAVDVTVEASVQQLISRTAEVFGPVEVLCQNAGALRYGGPEASDDAWATCWAVNVMAHVLGARTVLPAMLERGEGYLVHTCSAAGLLSDPAAAPYAVTKHAAVAFAEWLALAYNDSGIRVSAVCPQGVATPMLTDYFERVGDEAKALAGEIVSPEFVAEEVVRGIAEERFLILPHTEVAAAQVGKARDHPNWLAGMPRLRARRSD